MDFTEVDSSTLQQELQLAQDKLNCQGAEGPTQQHYMWKVAHLKSLLALRRQLEAKDVHISALGTKLEHAKAEVAAKDSQIVNLTVQLGDIEGARAEVAAKDLQISSLASQLAAKDCQIAHSTLQVGNLEAARAEVAAKDLQISSLASQLGTLQAELASRAAEPVAESSGGSTPSGSSSGSDSEDGQPHPPCAKRAKQESIQDLQGHEAGITHLIPGRLMSFEGKSSTSKVPVAFYRSTMSDHKLSELRHLFLQPLAAKAWSEERVDWRGRRYKQREVHFRLSKKAPQKCSNGADWKDPASRSARQWWRSLQEQNKHFYERLEAACRNIQYDTNRGPTDAFEVTSKGDFGDNIFSYASVQQREWVQEELADATPGAGNTYDYGTWHCDGGPSTIFAALSLEGSRRLQVETSNGSVVNEDLPSGSFYISMPAGFWHNVEPIFPENAGSAATQTSLILRSACLLRRISGGRQTVLQDGRFKRSGGMTYKTKNGFELMCRRVHDVIVEVFREGDFRL